MRVLIDEQMGLEVEASWILDEYGEPALVASFTEAHNLFEGWQALDPGSRGYRYGGGVDDSEPSVVILAWADRMGRLIMSDIDPFYDGVTTLNAYALKEIAAAWPVGMLKWGADIGEETP